MARTSDKDKGAKPEKKSKKEKDKSGASLLKPTMKPLKKGRRASMENHIEEGKLVSRRVRNRADEPESRCFTCLRSTLHCYNIVILILGVGALAVGIWLLVTEYSAREVSVLVGSQLFEIGTYLLLVGGGLIALLAFCGCCGTMREDRCVLAFYGVTLVIVLLSLLAGCGIGFVFRDSIGFGVKSFMANSIVEQYGVDLRKNAQNRFITSSWDSMQRGLHCCGAYGGKNSSFSWGIYKTQSRWYSTTQKRIPLVPESCCKGDDIATCTGGKQIEGPPTFGPPVPWTKKAENPYLNTEGCFEKAIVYLKLHSLVLGAVAGIVPIFLIFGIIIVFCLMARVRGSGGMDEVDL